MLAAIVQIGALGAALHGAGTVGRSKASVTTYQGTFADGATYLIQVPQYWNKTLVLYSHGYVLPGSQNPAYDVGDAVTGTYLLDNGYALAGSSYSQTGWAIAQALPDQIQTLDTFASLVGTPKRTIAWGHSMGGIITAGLVQQYPSRFDGAIPMCGVVAGGVGFWDSFLDSAFAFNTLVAGGTLQVVDITDPLTNYSNALTDIENAQNSPEGRARIALTAALADLPGWFYAGSPPPRRTDYAGQEANQYLWLGGIDFLFYYYLRAELESRAGGNPSWNNGISYEKLLAQSVYKPEVHALYSAAGLDLGTDLRALDAAAQIQVNQNALQYLSQNIIFDGDIVVPVLTLHTEGDGIVMNQNESAYRDVVEHAHNAQWLRELFVHRAGHCAFTPGETIVTFQTLIARLNSGKWSGLAAAQLNREAQLLGNYYNPYAPSFEHLAPAPFLRPYDGMP